MGFLETKQVNKDEMKFVGVFQTEIEAMHAIETHKIQGYSSDDISIIAVKDNGNAAPINNQSRIKAEVGLTSSDANDIIHSRETSLLAKIGVMAIPGVEPMLVTGPIVTKIMGVGLDKGSGGIIGGLIGMGISQKEAEGYARNVKEGCILVVVS